MILTYYEILKNKKNIHIPPFDKNLLNVNSYAVDHKKKTSYHNIDFTDEGYILSSNKTYLEDTFEEKARYKKYKGEYSGAVGPVASKMYMDFSKK